MSLPNADRLLQAMDATWPPARTEQCGPVLLRHGEGGGQRVSAATALGPVTETDIARAEDRMREIGQVPLFQIRPQDTELDTLLEARGYTVKDPVWLYAGHIADIRTGTYDGNSITPGWPLLAMVRQVWQGGGIGPGRFAVMQRATGPKTSLMARSGQDPAGVAFLAADRDVAMLHALEVLPQQRKRGTGYQMMAAAKDWAQDVGCTSLALAVTKENFAANALYAKCGMSVVSGYHYRRGQ